jgi:hypothetical protein
MRMLCASAVMGFDVGSLEYLGLSAKSHSVKYLYCECQRSMIVTSCAFRRAQVEGDGPC